MDIVEKYLKEEKREEYMSNKTHMSKSLGTTVNKFLSIIYKGDKVRMIVTEIPLAIDSHREHIVSDETVNKKEFDSIKSVLLRDLKKV